MNHGMKGRKFGRNTKHRKALLQNLAKSLIIHESICTTVAKAKDIRPVVEKLITAGKNSSLSNRRYLLSHLGGDTQIVSKVINVLAERYRQRAGGYLRISKTGFRKGDCASMCIIQCVQEAIAV